MADDLADMPIVVLENDFPEKAGRVGLFDIQMPVGDTGLIFIAAVPGRLYPWGVDFSPRVTHASYLRAACNLIQIGLRRGESFAFLRTALEMSQADVAAIYGVTTSEVMEWEDNTIPVPVHVWNCYSFRVMLADGMILPSNPAVCPSVRPRVIRVFPNVPMPSQPQDYTSDSCPQPLTGFPGADCYPPRRDKENF
jgi:hypothetical protein